jgi:transcription factor IIIB 90 kDa subunit
LEENAIISEVTFTEMAGGSSSVDGFFVSNSAARAQGKGRATNSLESREQTIANGHRRIADIGTMMRMTDRQIESAQVSETGMSDEVLG